MSEVVLYGMLVISSLLFSVQFLFNQKFKKSKDGCDTLCVSMTFSKWASLGSFIIFLLLARFRIQFTLYSFIIALLRTADNLLYSYFAIRAFSKVNLSVFSIFAMLGGLALPFVYGIIFSNEGLTFPKILCFILIIIAQLLTLEKSSGKKNSYCYCIAIFFFNGMSGVLAAIHAASGFPKSDNTSLSAMTSITTFIVCLAVLPIIGKKAKKKVTLIKKDAAYISCYALCSGIGNLFLLIALGSLPASVQYPFVTGGTVLFSTLIAFIMKEKPTVKTVVSALTALVAAIVIIL